MVYGRRSYRRNRRTRSRTLSTRNIYLRKSATNQAKQINALKRRVNYVSRQCRPEIKTWYVAPKHMEWNNSVLLTDPIYLEPDVNELLPEDIRDDVSALNPDWYDYPAQIANMQTGKQQPYTNVNYIMENYNGATIVATDDMMMTMPMGTAEGQRVGDTIKLKGAFRIGLSFNYINQAIGAEDVLDGAWVRIIVTQSKSERVTNTAFKNESIFATFGSYGVNYDGLVNCPLAQGITDNLAILRDTKIRLTSDSPQKQFVMHVKPKYRTIRFRDQESGKSNHSFQVFILVTGLKYNASVGERVEGTIWYKCGYTDN